MQDKYKRAGLLVPIVHDKNGEPSDISYEYEAPRYKNTIVHNGTPHYPDQSPAYYLYGEEIFPLKLSVI